MLLGRAEDVWTTNDVGMLKGLVQSGVRLGDWKPYLRHHLFEIKRAYIAAGITAWFLPQTVRTSLGFGSDRWPRGQHFPRFLPCALCFMYSSGGKCTAAKMPGGYAGKLLRVDLTNERIWTEPWTEDMYRTYLGGVGIGAKILWEEVPPEVRWDHPDNRLVLATGPMAGLPVWAPAS